VEKKIDFIHNPDMVKQKIEKVLSLIRQENLDLPMITKYCSYEYMKVLNEENVWQIMNLDLEYGQFLHQKE
jgi:hypothetical protein